MNVNLSNLADKILELSKNYGSKEADVIVANSEETSVDARKGEIEFSEVSNICSISLRVINHKKSAIVTSNDTSESSLRKLAIKVNEIANQSLENPFISLAESNQFAKSSTLLDIDIFDNNNKKNSGLKKLEELAITADENLLNTVGISNTDGSSAGFSNNEVFLGTSNGFSNGYKKTSFSISASAICSNNNKMERDYAFEQRTHFEDLPSPQEIGKLAAKRALKMIGAIKPPTGNYPVIFNERISSSIINHILTAINGETITRGSSWLLNSMDKKIMPENYSILEDPYLPRLAGSKPFDAEGLSTQKKFFIKNGYLRNWILDLKTSKQLGLNSTGNAFRSGSSQPTPGVGNIEAVGGNLTIENLFEKAGEGLMVCSMIGSSINQNNGDYSRGATGFWFKNGKISHPVNECTIAGNLNQMIENMMLANDSRSYLSRRVPSILVESMTIAGN